MLHAFDRRFGSDPRDTLKDATSDVLGKLVASDLLRRVSQNEMPPKDSEARLIGLAAGFGYAEISLAREFGYSNSQIVLVDRDFPLQLSQTLQKHNPDITYIESGLFTYLQEYQKRNIAVATLFGAEYLTSLQRMNELGHLLSKVMLPRGLVVIVPFNETNDSCWQNYDFQLVSQHRDVSVVYQYSGEIR